MKSLFPKGLTSDQFIEFLNLEDNDEDDKMFMDMGIPDTILKDFDKEMPFAQLIKKHNENTSKNYNKYFIMYTHQNILWRSTIYTQLIRKSGVEIGQLNIKLSHNGFKYHRRPYDACKIKTHKRNSWYSLTRDVLQEMPFLNHLKTLLQAEKVTFLYNIKHERMDIHFYRPGETSSYVLITFEHGYPESDPYDYAF
jgi:hypothetical protein